MKFTTTATVAKNISRKMQTKNVVRRTTNTSLKHLSDDDNNNNKKCLKKTVISVNNRRGKRGDILILDWFTSVIPTTHPGIITPGFRVVTAPSPPCIIGSIPDHDRRFLRRRGRAGDRQQLRRTSKQQHFLLSNKKTSHIVLGKKNGDAIRDTNLKATLSGQHFKIEGTGGDMGVGGVELPSTTAPINQQFKHFTRIK